MRLLRLILLFVLCVSTNADEEQHDFRRSNWYDTVEQVKSVESATFLRHTHEEINKNVSPPEPFPVNNLYYQGTLLDKPVMIQYRFDIDCGQLIQASYIFPSVLKDLEIAYLAEALTEKHGAEPSITASDGLDVLIYNYSLPKTRISIIDRAITRQYRGVTRIDYETVNWHWFGGFSEGTEPECDAFNEKMEKLKEKL